jgi:hypothetical protein
MELKAIYDSIDDIPDTVEDFRSLFVERDGRYELAGLSGVKSQADVDRLQKALLAEREAVKSVKERLKPWQELDYDEVMAKLDRLPELEAAAAGKLDDSAIEEIAARRVEGAVRSKLAPVERELKSARSELEELRAEREVLVRERQSRQREDQLRPLLSKANVLPEHWEDVLMYAERHLEQLDDGSWVARDAVGVTPGLGPAEWLAEMLERRPGWLPANVGGGARGSGAAGGVSNNPWSAAHWNMSEQGRILREKGREYADRLASAAGTKVGGVKPRK